jgi:hypothetical protein
MYNYKPSSKVIIKLGRDYQELSNVADIFIQGEEIEEHDNWPYASGNTARRAHNNKKQLSLKCNYEGNRNIIRNLSTSYETFDIFIATNDKVSAVLHECNIKDMYVNVDYITQETANLEISCGSLKVEQEITEREKKRYTLFTIKNMK